MTTGGSLTKTATFVRKGKATTVYNAFDDDSRLYLSIDGGEPNLLTGSPIFATKSKNITVPVGTHELTWTFLPGRDVVRDKGYGAIIRAIQLTGIMQSINNVSGITSFSLRRSHFFALQPVPCPFGTFAADPGMSHCLTCPANTEALQTRSTRCTPCQPFFSSLPGRQCEPIPPCQRSDYQEFYSDCASNTSAKYWAKINICRSDPAAPTHDLPTNETRRYSCPGCPPGTTHQIDKNSNVTKDCLACPEGRWLSESGVCTAVPKGWIAPKDLYLWLDNPTFRINRWPAGFSTGCDGIGCISNGWRQLGNHTDSGTVDSAFSDTWLQYNATLETDGFIRFMYTTEDHGEHSGLQFFVDGVSQPSVLFAPAQNRASGNINLSKGSHVLVWNYHLQSNAPASAAVKIWNVRIFGDARGGSTSKIQCTKGTVSNDRQTSCVACSPGTYAEDDGSTTCKNCPAGTISSEKASSCTKCPKGTVPNNKQTDCVTDCTFQLSQNGNKQSYDLTGLSGLTTVYSPSVIFFDICNKLPVNFSDPDGPKRDTYILEADDRVRPLGKALALVDKPGEGANVQLTYSTKDDDQCPQGSTVDFYFYCKMPNDR